MNNYMKIIGEIYQYLFMGSLIYIWYIVMLLGFKYYGYFVLKMSDTKFSLTKNEKILLWLSATTILTYIIK